MFSLLVLYVNGDLVDWRLVFFSSAVSLEFVPASGAVSS